MFFEIIGYISYCLILLTASSYILVIRRSPETGAQIMMGTVSFLYVFLPLTSIAFEYYPLFFISIYLSGFLSAIPLLSSILNFLSGIYLKIILIGINKKEWNQKREERQKEIVKKILEEQKINEQ